MDSDKPAAGGGRGIPTGLILLLVTGIGGYAYFSQTLKTARPEVPEASLGSPLGVERIEARLWQDPFQAVYHARKLDDTESLEALVDPPGRILSASEFAKRSVAALRSRERYVKPTVDKVARSLDIEIRFLPVFVPKDDFAESAESRRRKRVAVVSAFRERKMHPLVTNTIGCIDLELGNNKYLVPFEWYAPPEEQLSASHLATFGNVSKVSEYVCVFWFEDEKYPDGQESFLRTALREIYEEFELLQEPPPFERIAEEINFAVSIVGPDTSPALLRLAIESAEERLESQRRHSLANSKSNGGQDSLLDPIRRIKTTLRQLHPSGAEPDWYDIIVDEFSEFVADEIRLSPADEFVYQCKDLSGGMIEIVQLDKLSDLGITLSNMLSTILSSSDEAQKVFELIGIRETAMSELDKLRVDRSNGTNPNRETLDDTEVIEFGISVENWSRYVVDAWLESVLAARLSDSKQTYATMILLLLADQYLDDGLAFGTLPEDWIVDDLRKAVASVLLQRAVSPRTNLGSIDRASVEAALKDLHIEDSDETWYETVADMFVLEMEEPNGNSASFSEADFDALPRYVDSYLDEGLSDDLQKELVRLLREGQTKARIEGWGTTVSEILSTRSQVIQELEGFARSFGVNDSDWDWPVSVTDNWIGDHLNALVASGLAGRENAIDAVARGATTILLLGTNRYLDGSFPFDDLNIVVEDPENPAGQTVLARLEENVKELLQTDPARSGDPSVSSPGAPSTGNLPQRSGITPVFQPTFTWYSGRATLAADTINKKIADYLKSDKTQADQKSEFRLASIDKIVSVIPRDDELMDLIVEELSDRRGVNWERDHVVLISESDTLYGRELPNAFVRSLEQYLLGHPPDHCSTPKPDEHWKEVARECVLPFKYLRGLDGAVPGSKVDSEDSGEGGDAKRSSPYGIAALAPTGAVESAFGRAQLDYVRRLARLIRSAQSQFERGHTEGGTLNHGARCRIRAIGVLGSDVFDKGLILQALRLEFPDVVFFTTDFDVHFEHPDYYRWYRNLLIASGYGRQLSPLLQRQALPFRDSYQTGTYLATRLALGDIPVTAAELAGLDEGSKERVLQILGPNRGLRVAASTTGEAEPTFGVNGEDGEAIFRITKKSIGRLLRPRLFEISRYGAVDVTPHYDKTVPRGEEESAETPAGPRAVRTIPDFLHGGHTTRAGLYTPIIVAGGAVLIGYLLLFLFSRSVRRTALKPFFPDSANNADADSEGVLNILLISLAPIGIVLLIGVAILANLKGTEEPLYLFSGISVWPTESLRWIAIVLSIGLIVRSRIEIVKARDRVERYWVDRKRDANKAAKLTPSRVNLLARMFDPGIAKWTGYFEDYRRLSNSSDKMASELSDDETCFFYTDLWASYQWVRGGVARATRIGLWMFLFISFALLANAVQTGQFEWSLPGFTSQSGVRGEFTRYVDTILSLGSKLIFLFLLAVVIDIHRIVRLFTRWMSLGNLQWTAAERSSFAKDKRISYVTSLDTLLMTELMRIDFVAHTTKAVNRLWYFPFFTLLILIVSQLSVFDNWVLSDAHIAFAVGISVLLLLTGLQLSKEAGRIRVRSLAILDRHIRRSGGPAQKELELYRDQIANERRGAFEKFTRQPLIKAVLLPFGGIGVLTAFEILSMLGY